jgi:hypothetical protein
LTSGVAVSSSIEGGGCVIGAKRLHPWLSDKRVDRKHPGASRTSFQGRKIVDNLAIFTDGYVAF